MRICKMDLEMVRDCKTCGHSKAEACVKIEVFTADQLLTVEEQKNIFKKTELYQILSQDNNGLIKYVFKFIFELNSAQQKKMGVK